MRIVITAVLAVASLGSCESLPTGSVGDVLGGIAGQMRTTPPAGLSLSEVDAGLRQALEIGATNVSQQLGATDGFFGDRRVRIPLPNRLDDLQKNLEKIGLSGPLDDLQLRMNRAAEASMPEARKLIVSAVQGITLDDAVGILRGGDSAATQYLRGETEASLRDALTPYLRRSLESSGAFQALNARANQYGLSAVANDLRDDMTTNAVNIGLDGVFLYVAEEEKKIRENPLARTTDLLRKVFGAST